MTEEQSNIQQEAENVQPIIQSRKYQPMIGYGGQFAILMALFGAGLVVGALAEGLIVSSATHTSILDIEKTMKNPQYANVFKISQVISSVITFFIPAFFYALIINRKPIKYLGFIKTVSISQVFIVFLLAFSALFLTGSLGIINEIIPIPKSWEKTFHKMEDMYSDAVLAMVGMKNFGEYILALIVIAFAPAIVEETFFRGGLQQLFIKWFKNAWVGIIVTSIIFSAIHFSYYGFLARAALGIVLGLIFYYGKNIWLNILAHFTNNAMAVTQLYFLSRSGKNLKEAFKDDSLPFMSGHSTAFTALLMLIIGILITGFLLKIFKKESLKLGVAEIDNTIQPSDNPFDE